MSLFGKKYKVDYCGEKHARGKREIHTVYAKTRGECEELLEEMIPQVRAEIKAEKDKLKAKNETVQG